MRRWVLFVCVTVAPLSHLAGQALSDQEFDARTK
ncbi:MAG: hypothetical protein HW412_2264, partial [Bacteroidetes bacterium]|nr:hypothetical protein [Bacteroidota bacterium]